MSQLSLTEGNVRRALSRFAIPFLGASLLQFLYGAVDLIVVGQFADQAGIAAVSTGSQVMQAVTNFIIGLSTGGTVLVGQYLGARRGEDVNRAIGTLFSLFALIAVVLAAAFALSTNAIVALMQVPAAAVAPARQYLFICACGLVFITGYNMVSGVLRGLGDSKRPMYFVLVACIINIVGDLLLVGVFGLGAAGAALATVAAQGVSLALALAVLRRRDFPFDFKRRSFRIQGDKAARILRLGLPVAVQNVLVTLVFLQRLRPHRLHPVQQFGIHLPGTGTGGIFHQPAPRCHSAAHRCGRAGGLRRPGAPPAPLLPHRPVEPLGSGGGADMTAEVLAFLGGAPGPISLFEAWEEAVLACGESTMKVSKTQISWGNPLQFAVLSQPRRAAQRRTGALLATLGLGRRVEHPRILQAVEPYPGRWTHHLLLTAPEDVDGLLAAWLAEAYRFAREKQRRA